MNMYQGRMSYENKNYSPYMPYPVDRGSIAYNSRDYMQPDLDYPQSYCIIDSKNTGAENMSLVIMMKTKRGIVACTDSKSTIKDSFTTPYTEKERNAKKLFKTPKMIIVTHGANTVVSENFI